MKQCHTPTLLIAFLAIAISHTAFIITPKVNAKTAAITINAKAPPQYKAPKMTLFERIMLKKISKKINQQNDQIDLDKTASSVQRKGILSLGAILVTFLLLALMSITTLGFPLYLSIFTMLAAPTLAIDAIITANRILKNSAATDSQRKLAKKGRFLGVLSLIIIATICLFVGITFSNFS